MAYGSDKDVQGPGRDHSALAAATKAVFRALSNRTTWIDKLFDIDAQLCLDVVLVIVDELEEQVTSANNAVRQAKGQGTLAGKEVHHMRSAKRKTVVELFDKIESLVRSCGCPSTVI